VPLIWLLGNGSVKCAPHLIARQRLGKHIPAAMNTRNKRRIVGRVCLCISLSLLGNNSVKIFPRQQIIFGGVVFCVVRVVSKESRLLVLPRTSCFEFVLLFLSCSIPLFSFENDTMISGKWTVKDCEESGREPNGILSCGILEGLRKELGKPQ
jgi:hypothetical protein